MATTDNTYAGNTLDIYLNETWYNTLTTDAKAAIVDKNITQYQYFLNASVYNADTHASYADYSTKSVKDETGNRHIYALDVEDIEEYFNNEFSKSDIWMLFWNTTTDTSTYPWLRAASGIENAWGVSGGSGSLTNYHAASQLVARPVFQIDLAKIAWTPSN